MYIVYIQPPAQDQKAKKFACRQLCWKGAETPQAVRRVEGDLLQGVLHCDRLLLIMCDKAISASVFETKYTCFRYFDSESIF